MPEEKIKKEGNMKRLLWVLLVGIVVVGLLLAGCGGGGETGTIRVATDATWPPFEYVDTETGDIVGFDIDLFDAIAQRANLTVEYVNVAWDPLLAGMAQGTYDAAISSITIKPDRLEKMNFSHPYYVAGQIIVVLTSNTDITGPETLSGMLVGVQTGTTGDDEAQSINGTTVVGYDEIGLAFVALMTNQIDAVICDTPVAYGYVETYDTLKTVGEILTTEEYGIAVPKGKEDLLAQINTALDALLDEGIIDELTLKWLVH
jgi:polar amino acid transport system substrate-binding protein